MPAGGCVARCQGVRCDSRARSLTALVGYICLGTASAGGSASRVAASGSRWDLLAQCWSGAQGAGEEAVFVAPGLWVKKVQVMTVGVAGWGSLPRAPLWGVSSLGGFRNDPAASGFLPFVLF